MLLTSSHDAALERGRHRAAARGTEAVLVKILGDGLNETWLFKVSSFSRPDGAHGVAVTYSSRGVDVRCDCEAGINDRLCVHATVAVDTIEGVAPAPSSEVHAVA